MVALGTLVRWKLVAFASILALFLFATPGDSAAKDRVLVIPHEATILNGLEVRQEILDDCAPTLMLGDVLRPPLRKLYKAVLTQVPKDDTPYHLLNLEMVALDLLDIVGLESGVQIGVKKLAVRGELVDEKGDVIGSFLASRRSIGLEALGLKGGPCKILRKVNTRIGKDIKNWFKSSAPGALLGDIEDAKFIRDRLLALEQ